MARFHATNHGNIPFTLEEEEEWDRLIEEQTKQKEKEEPIRKAEEIRFQRNQLLAETDWVVIKAQESDSKIPSSWKQYRQELRDITEQKDFPHNIIWPKKPEI